MAALSDGLAIEAASELAVKWIGRVLVAAIALACCGARAQGEGVPTIQGWLYSTAVWAT
jgi:hypothetical protein